jgi:ABC-type sugar transport system ATPase subunit
LIREPKLLLMDEPLSNLDAQLREEMRDEIKELTRSLGVGTLHVTHDQTEAMALADTLAVMHDGRVLEIGKPEILYRQPGHQFVAEFLGRTNCIDGVVEANESVKTELGFLRCSLPNSAARGTSLALGIRSEWLELIAEFCSNVNSFVGTVEVRIF